MKIFRVRSQHDSLFLAFTDIRVDTRFSPTRDMRCVFSGDGRNHLSCLFRSLHLFFKLTRVGETLVPSLACDGRGQTGAVLVVPQSTQLTPNQVVFDTRAT